MPHAEDRTILLSELLHRRFFQVLEFRVTYFTLTFASM